MHRGSSLATASLSLATALPHAHMKPPALWFGWAALAAVLLHRVAMDLRQPLACDTTYLWQGYEDVGLPDGGRYRLLRFKDGDKDRAAGA